MPPPYSKHLPPHPASYGNAETRQRMRDNIESIRHTLRATRRTMQDARMAIARADEALAQRLSERR
jgi:hypothetical protein